MSASRSRYGGGGPSKSATAPTCMWAERSSSSRNSESSVLSRSYQVSMPPAASHARSELAGLQSEERVERAGSRERRGERHDADQAPHRVRAGDVERDEDDSEGNADPAIGGSEILLQHGSSRVRMLGWRP